MIEHGHYMGVRTGAHVIIVFLQLFPSMQVESNTCVYDDDGGEDTLTGGIAFSRPWITRHPSRPWVSIQMW